MEVVGGGGSEVWVGSRATLDSDGGSGVEEDFSGAEVGAAGVVPAVVGGASGFEEGDSESEGSSPVWPVQRQVSSTYSASNPPWLARAARR